MSISRIAIIAVHDSYLKSLVSIAGFLEKNGVEVQLYISSLISDRLIKQAKTSKYKTFSISDLQLGKWGQSVDAVFIGGGGSDLVKIASKTSDDLIKISLFPGITSEGIYKGFDDRLSTDVILISTAQDMKKMDAYLHDANAEYCTPFLLGYSYITKIHNSGSDIVYFEQNFPTMTYAEKAYIFEKLAAIARKYPEKKVAIKLRNVKGEETPHKAKHRIEDIMEKAGGRITLPPNLVLSYESVEDALKTAGLAISISSAAIIEALYNNIDSVIINDFGIRPDFSNYAFSGAGIYASLDDVLNGNIPSANKNWVEKNIVPASDNYPKLLEFLNNIKIEKGRKVERKSFKNKDILKEINSKKGIYGGMALHAESLGRKYRKFRSSPRIFFEDSKNIFIKPLGRIFK